MKWFVYSDRRYYPYAKVVEAETAQAAVRKAVYKAETDFDPVAVFPLDALALWKPHTADPAPIEEYLSPYEDDA